MLKPRNGALDRASPWGCYNTIGGNMRYIWEGGCFPAGQWIGIRGHRRLLDRIRRRIALCLLPPIRSHVRVDTASGSAQEPQQSQIRYN